MSNEPEVSHQTASSSGGSPAKSPNLLIVDDHRTTGLTLKAVLEREGFNVWYASDMNAANNLIDRKTVHVAIVDMDLDKHSGLEVLRTLNVQQPQCKSIVLTGLPSKAAKEAALQEGPIGFLVKPCDLNELILTIRKATDTPQS